jgi:hypothetical protein
MPLAARWLNTVSMVATLQRPQYLVKHHVHRYIEVVVPAPLPLRIRCLCTTMLGASRTGSNERSPKQFSLERWAWQHAI